MCQQYKHDDIKLGDDRRWKCETCGHHWEYGSIPLIMLEK